jgi:hypothetical protein
MSQGFLSRRMILLRRRAACAEKKITHRMRRVRAPEGATPPVQNFFREVASKARAKAGSRSKTCESASGDSRSCARRGARKPLARRSTTLHRGDSRSAQSAMTRTRVRRQRRGRATEVRLRRRCAEDSRALGLERTPLGQNDRHRSAQRDTGRGHAGEPKRPRGGRRSRAAGRRRAKWTD